MNMVQEIQPQVEKGKLMVADYLSMNADDPLLNNLGKVEIAQNRTHIEFEELNSEKWGGLNNLAVVAAPAEGKQSSGDRLIIRSRRREVKPGIFSNQIGMACLDGQTPVSPLASEIKRQAESFLKPDEGRDSIAPRIIASQAATMDYGLHQPFESRDLHANLIQILSNFKHGNQSEVVDAWHRLNILINHTLALENYRGIEADHLAGLTGTLVKFSGNSARLEFCSLADSPVILVYKGGLRTGLIKVENLNSNLPFDLETVRKMNQLITENKASGAGDARQILLNEDHFVQSYRKKCNITVPVCNGQTSFHFLVNLSPFSSESGYNLAAAIFCSDGLLNYLQSLNQGKRMKEFVKVVKMLLDFEGRSKVLDYIRRQEHRTWDEKKPTRERKGDDQQAVIMDFSGEKNLKNLILRMNW